jgi:hypothetical protein
MKRKQLHTARLTALLLMMIAPMSAQVDRMQTPTQAVPATLFGLHIHHLLGGSTPLTTWPSEPFGAWRLWDAYADWPNLEPKKDQWDFSKLDKYVDLAQQHGVDILLPLGTCPTWASSDPSGAYDGHTAPPKDINDWRNYVRTVATRYKGRIHNYEIWNEPNLTHFYSGNVQQMIELTREASRILREIDPTIKIVSPSATGANGVPWLDEFLKSGGGQYVDAIGFHLYVDPSPPESVLDLIKSVQTTMARYGMQYKQIWDTESGWGKLKPQVSSEESAGYVARTYVVQWAAGVSRFYCYAWDNFAYALKFVEKDGKTPTNAGVAYAEVEKWMVGARMMMCDRYSGLWNCRLQRDGGYSAWIVWDPNEVRQFPLQPVWGVKRMQDLNGAIKNIDGAKTIQIGPSPILLENSMR